MNADLGPAEELNRINRSFITVIVTILCLLVAMDAVLNEWRTQRITGRLETTPADVRDVMVELVESERKSHEAMTEVLYFIDLMEASTDAFVQIDDRGFIARWSRGAEELFGYDRSEALGLHVTVLMPLNEAELHRKRYEEAMQSNSTVSRRRLIEAVAVDADGRQVNVRLQLWIAPQLGAVARITEIEKPKSAMIN